MDGKVMKYLVELAEGYAEELCRDLEVFARHRSGASVTKLRVNGDDVRVCARRNPAIVKLLQDLQAKTSKQRGTSGAASGEGVGKEGKRRRVECFESDDDFVDGVEHGRAPPSP